MTQNTNVKPYLAITAAITAKVSELGLAPLATDPSTPSGLPENAGWVILAHSTDRAAPRIYLSKSGTVAESHVEIPVGEGGLPLPKPNGKIVCRVKPDADTLARATAKLSGASKVPTRRQAVAQPSPVEHPPVVNPAPASFLLSDDELAQELGLK